MTTTGMLVNIDVDDLDNGIDFYTRGLGLRLGRRLFGGAVAELLGGAVPVYLLAKTEGTAASTAAVQQRSYARHWTPVHLDFVVANMQESVDAAVAAGARLEGGVRDFAWGGIANMADPFGHGFRLIQFAGHGYGEPDDDKRIGTG